MKLKRCTNNRTFKQVSQTAGLLGVIADENRLKILNALKQGEHCVCDIWKDIGISQNLASHHLKVLKNVGLIDSRKEGLKIIYWINKKEINKFNTSLNNLLQTYGE
jgi:Predicted transcriptional regulators